MFNFFLWGGDAVNMVSRGVLERHVECCNHGATWGVLIAMHILNTYLSFKKLN